MCFSYVLITRMLQKLPLFLPKSICSGSQNSWCVDFLCKYPLELDHLRVLVRAELSFCCSDSPEAHAELLRRESATTGTICAFIDRWQASWALELRATHYLKMSFILFNISLLIVGELHYTHVDFLRQQGEMGISQSSPACQRRLDASTSGCSFTFHCNWYSFEGLHPFPCTLAAPIGCPGHHRACRLPIKDSKIL